MHRKLMIVILFAALLCGQVAFTHAQSANPTPQAEQAFIQDWSQEVIFPAAVRFRLTLALPPEQVSAVTLIIKPDSRPPVTIPIDLSSAIIVGGQVTGIAYIWQLAADNPPLLFKDITFDWKRHLNPVRVRKSKINSHLQTNRSIGCAIYPSPAASN